MTMHMAGEIVSIQESVIQKNHEGLRVTHDKP